MVEHLIFFLAKEEVARFYPYAKTFDSCKVNLLQVLSCKMDASPEVLESIVVAANISEDSTITPDGGKLIVTLITLTLATCLLS